MNTKLQGFDIHDKEVDAIVYTLLFAMVEIKGNDIWYEIYPEQINEDWQCYKDLWEERINRGSNNCYHNHREMENMIKIKLLSVFLIVKAFKYSHLKNT